MRRIGAPCTAVRVCLCVCVCKCVCVRACAYVCVRAQPTRIVRCVLLAPINLPRSRNLPRRRLSSRAEGRQKPKSAPDDAPVRLRWPIPSTSNTLNVHS